MNKSIFAFCFLILTFTCGQVFAANGKIIDALGRSTDAQDRALAQELSKLLAEKTQGHASAPVRKTPELER